MCEYRRTYPFSIRAGCEQSMYNRVFADVGACGVELVDLYSHEVTAHGMYNISVDVGACAWHVEWACGVELVDLYSHKVTAHGMYNIFADVGACAWHVEWACGVELVDLYSH